MRTLVISDIHNKIVRAQLLIDTVPHDRVILLGDYFDSYGDSMELAHQTAQWLKKYVLPNSNIIPLTGNHDMYYFFPYNTDVRGSGYSESKKNAIRLVLNQDDVDKFKFFTTEQGFALSHAGVTNGIWKQLVLGYSEDVPKPVPLEKFSEIVDEAVRRNVENLTLFKPADLFAVGYDRGGWSRFGGITWGDWNSLGPIKGINQIVGHTHQIFPQVLVQEAECGTVKKGPVFLYKEKFLYDTAKVSSLNYALDTGLNHYGIIEDGKFRIYDASTHMTIEDMFQKGMAFTDPNEHKIVMQHEKYLLGFKEFNEIGDGQFWRMEKMISGDGSTYPECSTEPISSPSTPKTNQP